MKTPDDIRQYIAALRIERDDAEERAARLHGHLGDTGGFEARRMEYTALRATAKIAALWWVLE